MLKCIDPATGQVIERICRDDRRTVHRTFRQLEEGQRRWGETSREQRAAILENVRNNLDEQRVGQVGWLVREVGTPIRQARREIETAVRRIDEIIEAGTGRPAGAEPPSRQFVEREPLGVLAHISTWSHPCLVGVEVMVAALLAGNAVLYKPSRHAALTGRALVELMWESGVPEDVVDLVVGDGSVGDYVLDESVAGVFFAGSYNTGQMISQKLATRMIPQHMELGGKDGAYVCEDVDVQRAARHVADVAFYNSGRGRRAFDRLYVHEQVYRRFTDGLCRRIESYRMGNPSKEETFVGPVVDHRWLGELEHQVGDAVRKGARVLLGGRVRGGKGHFFTPTVVADADHRMLVMREESPGPVLALKRVCGDDEALHRLGDCDVGLTAGVFSEDRRRARRLLSELQAGSVYWNDCRDDPFEPPATATRPLGVNLPLGTEGTWRFTRPKSWAMDRGSGPV